MPSVEHARWRVGDGSNLLWRLWDEEYVVFDSRSGDMHLLDLLAGDVLKDLEQSPATVPELTLRVASMLEVEPDSGLSLYVEKLLAELDALGLIEPGPVDTPHALPGTLR